MRNSDVFVSGVPVAIEGATINQDTQRTSTVFVCIRIVYTMFHSTDLSSWRTNNSILNPINQVDSRALCLSALFGRILGYLWHKIGCRNPNRD